MSPSRPSLALAASLVVFASAFSLAQQPQQPPQSDAVVNPLAGNAAAVQAGARLFASACASCHGTNGIGDARAPALNGGARSFAHGYQDMEMFKTIQSGVPRTEMDPNPTLSANEIWQLVAYVKSLNAETPAPPAARGAGAPAGASAGTAGNAAAGETVFFSQAANCASCHMVNGRGGAVGPDLSAIGQQAPDALRAKILDPNTPAPGAAGGGRGGGRGGRGGPGGTVTVIVKERNGQTLRGVRRSEDTFSLQMIDATGALRSIDKTSVASVEVDPTSLMPAYTGKLSGADVDNLVAYLATLKERTPVASKDNGGGGMTFERLKAAASEPQNWPMYWGNYQGTHYSALKQIDATNAGQLQALWATPIPGDSILENTPIVVDGIMYVTGSGNPLTVTAMDAKTGRQIWRYTRQQPVRSPFENNRYNRGVAILGNRLFVGTLDAMLIALDARNGSVLWQVQMADTMEGYELTSPPLVVKDLVIMGISGGEYAIRGFVDAYDAATGQRKWRFYTIPGPGEFGNETWKGDSWQKGGGAAWLTPTYDAELNQVYIAVGNPAPQIDRSIRGDGLDNLFSCSVVALDADTGVRKWHYQFTPNDGHDWDSTEDMVLVDRVWHGQPRKLLMHADRNGFFYVLDRTNGKFLQATPFIYQNWNGGFDANGRPVMRPGMNSAPDQNALVYPTLVGGTNYQPPSYSPLTGWFYLEYAEGGATFASAPPEFQKGQQYIGRPTGRGAAPPSRGPNEPAPSAGVRAIDPETGKVMWDFKIFQSSLTNGVLATAGNVVFASVRDGNIAALDAKTGKALWHFQSGATNAAAPISYSVDGRQYVALAMGNFVYGFALPVKP